LEFAASAFYTYATVNIDLNVVMLRDVAIIVGAGLVERKTYTSLSGSLLGVFTCCFLASHVEL
jgi:hypothetical protein